jgi:hypothetical protein
MLGSRDKPSTEVPRLLGAAGLSEVGHMGTASDDQFQLCWRAIIRNHGAGSTPIALRVDGAIGQWRRRAAASLARIHLQDRRNFLSRIVRRVHVGHDHRGRIVFMIEGKRRPKDADNVAGARPIDIKAVLHASLLKRFGKRPPLLGGKIAGEGPIEMDTTARGNGNGRPWHARGGTEVPDRIARFVEALVAALLSVHVDMKAPPMCYILALTPVALQRCGAVVCIGQLPFPQDILC